MDDVLLARDAIRRWFDTAVACVEPRRAVVTALARRGDALIVNGDEVPLSPSGRIIVLSIGKAAVGMAEGALDVLEGCIDAGIILTKEGHAARAVPGFDLYEAAHPQPDERCLVATQAILTAVEALGPDDLVIALISGGGSALLELPVAGLSLADIQQTTRVLMHAGAGIHDLNAVRTALSRVKGGGVRRIIGDARCVSLLLSDVIGNDPTVIASGPTVVAPAHTASARSVIDRFGVRSQLPPAVLRVLDRPLFPPTSVDTRHDAVAVIADNAAFTGAVARGASDEGLNVTSDPVPYTGDAAELGRAFVSCVREVPATTDVIVRGGEATVEVLGDGIGGRNTEMALAAALAMAGDDSWIIASLASDGDDGNSGATGALADGGTAFRALTSGVDPAAALMRNDSAAVFRAAGGLIVSGPTGTNVNDVYIALRRTALARQRDLT